MMGAFTQSGQLVDSTGTIRTVTRAFANVTLLGPTIIVPAQSGFKIRVISLCMVPSAGVTVKFQSNVTDISASFPLVAGGLVLPPNSDGWFETAVSEALRVNTGLAIGTGVHFTYILVQ